MSIHQQVRPRQPPFSLESATLKLRQAEDRWNTRDPLRVLLACSADSVWRQRSEFSIGRMKIMALLQRQWAREQENRVIMVLWALGADRMALRSASEWCDEAGIGYH